jgi:hypothetical protein
MLHLIKIAFGLGFLAIAAYVAYTCYTSYKEVAAQPGEWNGWERLWAAGRGSATKLWAKFVMLVAGLTANLDSIADFLGMPELKTAIDTYIGNPKIIAGVMLIISLVTIKARNRTA